MLKGPNKNVEIRNIIKEIKRFELNIHLHSAYRFTKCKIFRTDKNFIPQFYGKKNENCDWFFWQQHTQIVISLHINQAMGYLLRWYSFLILRKMYRWIGVKWHKFGCGHIYVCVPNIRSAYGLLSKNLAKTSKDFTPICDILQLWLNTFSFYVTWLNILKDKRAELGDNIYYTTLFSQEKTLKNKGSGLSKVKYWSH